MRGDARLVVRALPFDRRVHVSDRSSRRARRRRRRRRWWMCAATITARRTHRPGVIQDATMAPQQHCSPEQRGVITDSSSEMDSRRPAHRDSAYYRAPWGSIFVV